MKISHNLLHNQNYILSMSKSMILVYYFENLWKNFNFIRNICDLFIVGGKHTKFSAVWNLFLGVLLFLFVYILGGILYFGTMNFYLFLELSLPGDAVVPVFLFGIFIFLVSVIIYMTYKRLILLYKSKVVLFNLLGIKNSLIFVYLQERYEKKTPYLKGYYNQQYKLSSQVEKIKKNNGKVYFLIVK